VEARPSDSQDLRSFSAHRHRPRRLRQLAYDRILGIYDCLLVARPAPESPAWTHMVVTAEIVSERAESFAQNARVALGWLRWNFCQGRGSPSCFRRDGWRVTGPSSFGEILKGIRRLERFLGRDRARLGDEGTRSAPNAPHSKRAPILALILAILRLHACCDDRARAARRRLAWGSNMPARAASSAAIRASGTRLCAMRGASLLRSGVDRQGRRGARIGAVAAASASLARSASLRSRSSG
jgi:hypothetical protein